MIKQYRHNESKDFGKIILTASRPLETILAPRGTLHGISLLDVSIVYNKSKHAGQFFIISFITSVRIHLKF